MGWEDAKTMSEGLVGHNILEVWWSEDRVTFKTDDPTNEWIGYSVYGDCCSHSYLADLIGLDKLLSGPVLAVEEVTLTDAEQKAAEASCAAKNGYEPECLQVYGFRLVSEHPEWGEVSCVFSFRNESNGYYGGWAERSDGEPRGDQKRLHADIYA